MNLNKPFGPRDEPSDLLGDAFFRGVDERTPPNQLDPGWLSRGKNLRFRAGNAAPRKGMKICPWMKGNGRTPFTEVYGAVVFADPNQAGDWIIIAADGGVWKTRPNMTATAVPLPSTVSLTRETFEMFVPCTDAGDSVLVLLRGPDNDPLVCTNIDIGFTAVPTKQITLTSLTSVSTTATATKAAHGLEDGALVVIEGATPSAYNGQYEITVTSTDTFTYTFAGSGTSPATGTIKARLAGRRDMPRSRFGVNTANRLLLIEDRDNVAASDLLAYNDFLALQNEFRINTGQSDRLERIQPLIGNRLLMFKTNSVLEVQNVGSDLSLAVGPLDVTNKYGLAAPHGCARSGSNCYWVTGEPAIASLRLTELNETQDTDRRLSDDLPQTFGRVNPLALSGAALEIWDGKLYCALPLDAATTPEQNIIPNGATYTIFGIVERYTLPIRPGVTYRYVAGVECLELNVGGSVIPSNTDFTWDGTGRPYLYAAATGDGIPHTVTATVTTVGHLTNNAIAVYDFVTQAWCGVDEAEGVIAVKHFLKTPYQGKVRLFAIGTDGVLRLLEEGFEDEVFDAAGNIVPQAIETMARTRAYQTGDRIRTLGIPLLLSTWNPNYTVKTVRQDYNRVKTIDADGTRDRTKYDLHDATDYDPTNANDDAEQPGRFDYSVVIPAAGLNLGSGINLSAHQTSTVRIPADDIGVYFQIEVSNTQGRCALEQCAIEQQPHERRSGAEVN